LSLIAIDLGGTKLATARFDDSGALLDRDSVALGGRTGMDVAALIVERLAATQAEHEAPSAVGIAVPGIYRAARGTVWAPNIPGWHDFPLRDVVARALGRETTLVIDSDRAAYIAGEAWRGAAKGARDAIFIAVGTGIGAGILVDGRVLRGHGDVAGAIGWLALDRPFRPAYADCGCFEHHASGPGLLKVARELLAADASYAGELRRGDPASLDTAALFAAADRGDAIATRAIENAIAMWGMAAANLVSLFNPQVIVFGGGVFGPAARYIDDVRAEALRWAQPIAVRETAFVVSTLGADAGLHGAARLALLARPELSATHGELAS
jgi:glucokinase